MKTILTSLPDCLIVEPKVFGDARGFFFEAFNLSKPILGHENFAVSQINISRSTKHVLRGLHFQSPNAQGKLVWVLEGEVFDVAVDLRTDSPTFGHWEGVVLSATNHRQFLVPEGFAHGFQVMSDHATFCYICTRPYQAEFDRAIHYADPQLRIDWPNAPAAVVSAKDAIAPSFAEATGPGSAMR
jgi:dTDP-4-dehydrorhamnose 3,5-epimerase